MKAKTTPLALRIGMLRVALESGALPHHAAKVAKLSTAASWGSAQRV